MKMQLSLTFMRSKPRRAEFLAGESKLLACLTLALLCLLAVPDAHAQSLDTDGDRVSDVLDLNEDNDDILIQKAAMLGGLGILLLLRRR